MNILVAISQNYSIPFITMLKSMFRHNKCHINVYLLYSELEEVTLKRLREYVEENGSSFIPIKVSDKMFGDSPTGMYFTKEMYYRMLAPLLLPEEEERVLYLDVDLMVRGSIEEFYYLPFDGNMLIGMLDECQDMPYSKLNLSSEMQWKRLHMEYEGHDYINSGVLLMNLRLMRERKFDLNDIFRIIEEKKEYLLYPDQDAINIYFRGSIKVWKKLYNFSPGFVKASEQIIWPFSVNLRHMENPIIVHYFGSRKPWDVHCRNKYIFEYHRLYKEFAPLSYRLTFLFKPLICFCDYLCTVFICCILKREKRPSKTPTIKKLLR